MFPADSDVSANPDGVSDKATDMEGVLTPGPTTDVAMHPVHRDRVMGFTG